jgi:small GTP-binding protein
MALAPNRSRQFKTALIGDTAVGKTSIRRAYMGKGFVSSHIATLGVDFAQKNVEHEDKMVRLTIWDLAGEQSYENVRKLYYDGCHSVIFVYSVIDKRSFKNATLWLAEVNKYVKPMPPVAILGNKIDLRKSSPQNQVVDSAQGEEYAQALSTKLRVPVLFSETSALTGENIDEVFDDLITMMLERNPVRRHANRC